MHEQTPSEKGTQLWRWVNAANGLPPIYFASTEMGEGSATLNLLLNGIPFAGRYVKEAGQVKNAFVIAGVGFYNESQFSEIEWLERLPEQQTEEDGWVRVEDGLPEVIQRSHNSKSSEWVLVSSGENSYNTELAIYYGKEWFTSCSPHPEKRVKFWKYVSAPK